MIESLFDYLKELDTRQGLNYEQGLLQKIRWIRRYFLEVDRLMTEFHGSFTLHDRHHTDAVAAILFEIVQLGLSVDPTNEQSLSRHETFYLLAATYLHDIGMVWKEPGDDARAVREEKPVGDLMRADHEHRSARFVQDKKAVFLLDPRDVRIIKALCRGHRAKSFDAPEYDNAHDDRNRPIRTRLLAGLLTVADELDMTHTRAPEWQRLLMETKAKGELNPLARQHWMKHYYTESVWFAKAEEPGERKVRINVRFRVPDEVHLDHVKRQVTARVTRHLGGLSFAEHGFKIEIGNLLHTVDPDLASSVLLRKDVRILYVDDDELHRLQVVQQLHGDGFIQCDVAVDARSAVAKLAAVSANSDQEYHLIILDLVMPDLNGVPSQTAGRDLVPIARKLFPDAQVLVFTSTDIENSEHLAHVIEDIQSRGVTVIHKAKGPVALAEEIERGLKQRYIIADEPKRREVKNMSDKSGTRRYVPEPYKVLIVDDDELWAQACGAEVEKKGLTVEYAGGADQAVQKMKATRFHAAILDKNMPDLNGIVTPRAGLDLFEYIRDNQPDITCLMLTITPSFESYREAQELGMFAYREKEEGYREVADLMSQIFKLRLDYVFTQDGRSVQADRMYFFGKPGRVTKNVTTDVNPEYAGIVEIEGEKWVATTSGSSGRPIPAGTEVRALGIRDGVVQVDSTTY